MLHELIAKQKDITLINQEVMPDHVHLFVTAHPIFAPANIAKIGSSLNCVESDHRSAWTYCQLQYA